MHTGFNSADSDPRIHDIAVLQLNASVVTKDCTATVNYRFVQSGTEFEPFLD
jgi:hypothetical protein